MQPLHFEPILKRIRWGGTRLGTVLGKPLGDATDYAESWEISDHGADQSIVSTGPLRGKALNQLISEFGDTLLGSAHVGTQFPLLIKFLDAHDRLSLQVHPNDTQARTYDPDENGKTEAWVILATEPGSRLYAGLKSGVTRDQFQQQLSAGTVEECLHSFEVNAGDCVYVPAGTVHAIGEGVLLAEVQQSSDMTFRIHDWGRMGSDGQPRELHIDQALSCIDFDRGPVDPVCPQRLPDGAAVTEELVRCDKFLIRRHQLDSAVTFAPEVGFRILMLLAGTGALTTDETSWSLVKGNTVLIPASCPAVQITPEDPITLLEVSVP